MYINKSLANTLYNHTHTSQAQVKPSSGELLLRRRLRCFRKTVCSLPRSISRTFSRVDSGEDLRRRTEGFVGVDMEQMWVLNGFDVGVGIWVFSWIPGKLL